MKLFSTLLLSALLFSSCQKANKQDGASIFTEIKTISDFDVHNHVQEYKKLKKRIAAIQEQVKANTATSKEQKKAIAKSIISTFLVDSIFPYWMGTTWDFNGYTETPRQGDVACGYFVSTTLRDVGIHLNRYKTAQKAASGIVEQLCSEHKRLSSYDKVAAYLDTKTKNEIMIVGLDFHVGFILRWNDESYFAHSNYIDRAGVMLEKIEESTAFKQSEAYVIGSFSNNPAMLENWLN